MLSSASSFKDEQLDSFECLAYLPLVYPLCLGRLCSLVPKCVDFAEGRVFETHADDGLCRASCRECECHSPAVAGSPKIDVCSKIVHCISDKERLVHEKPLQGALMPLPHFRCEICDELMRHECARCELSICFACILQRGNSMCEFMDEQWEDVKDSCRFGCCEPADTVQENPS